MRRTGEAPSLARVVSALQNDRSIGYRGLVYSFPPDKHFQRVDIILGPRKPIAPDDPMALNAFQDSLLQQFQNDYAGIHHINQHGALVLGSIGMTEILPGSKRTATITYYDLADPKLYEQAEKAGLITRPAETNKEPISRLIEVRPYPNTHLARGIARFERGYLEGRILIPNEVFPMIDQISAEQIDAILRGEFSFPRAQTVVEGDVPPTAFERAERVQLGRNWSKIKRWADFSEMFFAPRTPEQERLWLEEREAGFR